MSYELGDPTFDARTRIAGNDFSRRSGNPRGFEPAASLPGNI